MQILITFIVFSILCLIFTYYFNLFVSQTVYTKSEISDILPQIGNMIQKIFYKYSIFYLLGFYFISGLTAILILSIFKNWFFNSALIPLIFYYSGQRLAVFFEQTRITISEDFKDIAEALYVKYYNYILIGFFSGYASKLIDNWINVGSINFYWLIVNLFIITSITILTLKSDVFD